MKKLLLFFCLHQCLIYGQTPTPSLHLNIGAWRDYFAEPYGQNIQKLPIHSGVGLGLRMMLSDHLAFSPELGLEGYGLSQTYLSNKDSRHVSANLGLFYGRISPGIMIRPAEKFSIRTGLGMMVSAFTVGSYTISYVDHNINKVVRIQYDDHFSRIRSPVVFGPELGFHLDLPQELGEVVSFGLTSFLSLTSIFQPDFWTPSNPRIFRVGLEVSYTFPPPYKPEHGYHGNH